ncbi:MAG: methyltransferase domain-containing protein, partial [bacterium]|nr:methyltransferase domain-containing protein [bacterium]
IDVLEHQTEPEEILKIFESKLKPNGYFIMSVPNIAYWTMRLKLLFGKWEYEEVGMLNYTHYRFYTADSLKKFIKNHGYELINFFIIKDDSKFFLRKFIVSILFFFFPRLFGNSLLSVFKPLQEPIGK